MSFNLDSNSVRYCYKLRLRLFKLELFSPYRYKVPELAFEHTSASRAWAVVPCAFFYSPYSLHYPNNLFLWYPVISCSLKEDPDEDLS